jgi:hypothetical protein
MSQANATGTLSAQASLAGRVERLETSIAHAQIEIDQLTVDRQQDAMQLAKTYGSILRTIGTLEAEFEHTQTLQQEVIGALSNIKQARSRKLHRSGLAGLAISAVMLTVAVVFYPTASEGQTLLIGVGSNLIVLAIAILIVDEAMNAVDDAAEEIHRIEAQLSATRFETMILLERAEMLRDMVLQASPELTKLEREGDHSGED